MNPYLLIHPYDCEVEFYCVPTNVAPKTRR